MEILTLSIENVQAQGEIPGEKYLIVAVSQVSHENQTRSATADYFPTCLQTVSYMLFLRWNRFRVEREGTPVQSIHIFSKGNLPHE
jgi:hypothetical protein